MYIKTYIFRAMNQHIFNQSDILSTLYGYIKHNPEGGISGVK